MKITKRFCTRMICFCMLAIISLCPVVVFASNETLKLSLCMAQASFLIAEYVFLWLRSKMDD